MEDIGSEELTVFYKDDNGHNQGPYAAAIVLGWFQQGFFTDDHLIRITDNGQRVGNRITIENTLGELKKRFGQETPIPLTIDETEFRGFSLKPLSNRQPVNMSRTESRLPKKIELLSIDIPDAKMNGLKSGAHIKKKMASTEDSDNSVWVPDKNDRTLPTPRQNLKAGPKLPSTEKTRIKRLTSDEKWKNNRKTSPSDDERKRRRNNASSSSSSSSDDSAAEVLRAKKNVDNDCYGPVIRCVTKMALLPIFQPPPPKKKIKIKTSERSSPAKKCDNLVSRQKKLEYLPFYHGDDDKAHCGLRQIIAIELATILRSQYSTLLKRERDELHRIVFKWGLPDRCKLCDCELKHAPNFLSHVLSGPHLTKSFSKNYRFTFEGDYMIVKKVIEDTKKPSRPEPLLSLQSSRHPSSSIPSPSFKSNDRDIAYNAREKCTQS